MLALILPCVSGSRYDRMRYQIKYQFLVEVIQAASPGAALAAFPAYLVYPLAKQTGPRTAFLLAAGRHLPPLVAYLSCSDAEFCQQVSGQSFRIGQCSCYVAFVLGCKFQVLPDWHCIDC